MSCWVKVPVGGSRPKQDHTEGPLQPEWTQSLSVGCSHYFGTGEKKDGWVAAQADGQQACFQSTYQRGERPPYRSPCFESKIALPGAWLGMDQLLRDPLS